MDQWTDQTDRLGHREVLLQIIILILRPSRWTNNFVSRIGSSSYFVNLWGILKKISRQKKIIPAKINKYTISPIPVYDLVNTSIWLGQYQYMILSILVYVNFNNSGIRFGQYRYMIWSMPVYDFVNTGIQFHQYWYTISSILVYDFINTGIRFHQYWQRYIFKGLGRFKVENKDS